MNISQIRNLPDETEVGLTATVATASAVRQFQGAWKQNIKLSDASGQGGEEKTIWAEVTLPANTPIVRLSEIVITKGKMSSYTNDFGLQRKVLIDEYSLTTSSEPPITTPQNTSQPPPQAAQAPQVKKEVDWDAKELRERRGYAQREAVLLIATAATIKNNAECIEVDNVLEVAEELLNYVYDGLEKAEDPKDDMVDDRPF